MKIEDEIKQGRFENEFQKATLNILVTASWLSSQMNSILKQFGISQAQYNVLRILRGQKCNPCSLGTITERMVDKMSNATRLVEKLRVSGYVTREVCPNNRRKVDIMVTDAGLKLLSDIDPLIKKKFDELNQVAPEDLAKLNEVLDQIRS